MTKPAIIPRDPAAPTRHAHPRHLRAHPCLLKPDARFLLVLGCFLLSGAAGLVYQTAWTQQFTLTFGASELAVVAVLAAYMAGLTAGAAAAARWLGRVRRPVLAYGLLEMGTAIC